MSGGILFWKTFYTNNPWRGKIDCRKIPNCGAMYIGNVYTEPTRMFVFDDIAEIKGSKFTNKVVEYMDQFMLKLESKLDFL